MLRIYPNMRGTGPIGGLTVAYALLFKPEFFEMHREISK
jgi:hypothetical protein